MLVLHVKVNNDADGWTLPSPMGFRLFTLFCVESIHATVVSQPLSRMRHIMPVKAMKEIFKFCGTAVVEGAESPP